MQNNLSKGFKIAKIYDSKIAQILSNLTHNKTTNIDESPPLFPNLYPHLSLAGYGSPSPIQNPALFKTMITELSDIETPNTMLSIGKTAINYNIRNGIFWRQYFDLCHTKFMDNEKGFNDFLRLKLCSSLGGYKDGEWINDSILRKFKDEVQGCRYLMLMMVSFC